MMGETVQSPQRASAGSIPIVSAGRPGLRTSRGTAISYPSGFPNEQTRYFILKPEQAVAAADALSKKVSSFFRSKATGDGRLPVNIYEIEVKGQRVALVSSGDQSFYFGAGELAVAQPYGAYLADLDMRDLDKEQRGFFAGSRPQLEEIAAKLA
jgi:hypothetical protein